MKTIAVLNAMALSGYAFEKLNLGKSAFEMVLEYAQSIPDISSIIILHRKEEIDGWKGSAQVSILPCTSVTMKDLLHLLEEQTKSFDTVFYFYADCPLLDKDITRRMYDNHNKYFAEYTFADGYPYGLTPEILKPSVFQSLSKLAEKGELPISRDGIFTVLQKDINAFDVETEISSEDLRLLRVSLSCDTKRDFSLVQSIIDAGGTDEKTITGILLTRGEILRTYPAYIGVQITSGCLQSCSYCPYPRFGGDILSNRNQMEVREFRDILEKVHRFSEDAVICPSLWGEPSLHSDVPAILEAILEYPAFRGIIETSGLGWSQELLNELRSLTETYDSGPDRIDWIVSLDAMDEQLYRDLRGSGMEEALTFCELAGDLFPGRVYVQAVRMKKSEEDLEQFFRYWKDRLGNVIIQKYDHLCGFLDERKVTDLSPLKRFPCWHIKRDLSVLMDGTVPLCREDVNRKHILGNIFTDSLEDLWQRGDRYYERHVKSEYPEICTRCDEYYTYNF